MHRSPLIVIVAALLSSVASIHAGTFFYSHPDQVDLSRDRTVISSNATVNDYNWESYLIMGSGGSYTLNLGSSEAVGKIQFKTIYRGAGNGLDFGANNWSIDTSDDGSSWTLGPIHTGGGPASYVADFTGNPTPFTTQYIRFNASGNISDYGICLEDVHVFGDSRVPIAIRNTLNIAGANSNNGVGSNSQINDEDSNDGSYSPNTYGIPVFAGSNLDVHLNDTYDITGMRWGIQNQYGNVTGYNVYTIVNNVVSATPIYTGGTLSPSQYIDFGGSYTANGLRLSITSYSGQAGYPTELEVFGNAVPEPASIGLLAIGGMMISSRRRRIV